MMKNRLEVAHKLLSSDGSIWIQCDDNEMHYLKVLLDEIFERDNYVNTISVTMKNVAGASGGGEDKRFKKNIEYILVYAKDYNCLKQFSGFVIILKCLKCIFRKNCASVPEERSAIPLQTEQSSAG